VRGVGGAIASLLALSAAPPASAADSVGAPAPQGCVEAQVGKETASSLGCLNEQLKAMADQAQTNAQNQPTAPIDATSGSTAVGTANDAAAREHMGNAFGKSAIPQRPTLYSVSPLLQTH
jgi:hypothetical protein